MESKPSRKWMVILMTNCKINKHVQEWIDIVENGTYETCEDQKRLVKYVKHCFETEDIYMDDEQFEKYIRLIKYFPYDILMPWQKFVIGLHDCTYWRETGMPRWPDLFCLIGRGARKRWNNRVGICLSCITVQSWYTRI